MYTSINNAALLSRDDQRRAVCIVLEEGRIVEIKSQAGQNVDCAQSFDAQDLLVLPGIVDIHGDAFERQLMPRPGVYIDPALALMETDRQMIANGITTAYHGISVSWEPGLRSISSARKILEKILAQRPGLACDTRIHLRFETHALEALPAVIQWIRDGHIDLLAFNDHTDHILGQTDKPSFQVLLDRSGLSRAQFQTLLERILRQRSRVPAAIDELARLCRTFQIPMASHDDESVDMRRHYERLGCTICEFPMTLGTARHARRRSHAVVMGAPNILLGASHCGRLSGKDLVSRGLCSVLSSDYFYPALNQAPMVLAAGHSCTLYEAWQLVSANAAQAAGLSDRGRIALGKRADLVILDDRSYALPRVVATFCNGRLSYLSEADLMGGLQFSQSSAA